MKINVVDMANISKKTEQYRNPKHILREIWNLTAF